MVIPRLACRIVSFIDKYCETDRPLFADVHSFQCFEYLHVGLISDLLCKSLPVTAFQVDRLMKVSKRQFLTEVVYGKTDRPTLRLVTCGGSFNQWTGYYRDNIIVFASLATPSRH